MKKYILGIDIGGTKTIVGLASATQPLIDSISFPTQAEKGRNIIIQQITKQIDRLLKKNKLKRSQIEKIGIGVPGIVVPKKGVVLDPPNLPGWKKVNLGKIFRGKFNVPVFVENDADAASLAEAKFGAGVGLKNFVFLTVSTGIGAGIIIDKKIYKSTDFSAAEAGHMIILPGGPRCGCGHDGCLEALASGTALSREAAKLFGRKMDAAEVGKLAKEGDPTAEKIVEKAAEFLGMGIANIANLLAPEAFIIGGGLSNMGDTLFRPALNAARHYAVKSIAQKIKIIPAKNKTNAGILGAIAICL